MTIHPVCRPMMTVLSTLGGVIALVFVAQSGTALAATPVKLVLSAQYGREVDRTTKGHVCTVASKDECQPGRPGVEPVSFDFPADVAGAPSGGDVYVADAANNRVQELTASGAFVLMFGNDVNKTKQTNLCTAEELAKGEAECQGGEPGTQAGAFQHPRAIAIDPASGIVYVAEPELYRVQEYTTAGQFVLMIGNGVNKSKETNLCTAQEVIEEAVECGRGTDETVSTEQSAFAFPAALSVGGPEDLLYVGDVHRVEEFKANGAYAGELRKPLEAISSDPNASVTSLATDPAGNSYLAYRPSSGSANVVREFSSEGKEIRQFPVEARQPKAEAFVREDGVALDSAGHLAISGGETAGSPRGMLYDVASGEPITEITTSDEGAGIGFNSNNELFEADLGLHEISAYKPQTVAELITGPGTCIEGQRQGANLTLDCTVNGEVNPDGVAGTEAWFQWGQTPALGSETPKQAIPTGTEAMKVSSVIEDLPPNETFVYRLAGIDEVVKLPELLSGKDGAFKTPLFPPLIVGAPRASVVNSTSAVLFGELDPENDKTRYALQYGTCEELNSCPDKMETSTQESPVYGALGTTVELTGLRPSTRYFVKLVAKNEAGSAFCTPEPACSTGTFGTTPVPVVEAATGPASAVTATSAVISGSVNPRGETAGYSFELGIYRESGTEYGIISSGQVPAGEESASRTFTITGLQPGIRYAYRISAHNGFGSTVGAPQIFTTLAETFNKPQASQLVPVPEGICFPGVCKPHKSPKCTHGHKRNKHGRCVPIRKRKHRKR